MSDTEVKDNSKLFRKIVRDFNKEYGYSFKLPKDTDYSSKYAQPIHEADGVTITSQIDDDGQDRRIYAIRFKIDGVRVDVGYKTRHYSEILKMISTPQFEKRLASLKQLEQLATELYDQINTIQSNLMDDTITDIERDETYDTITRAARQIYKS